MWHTQYFTQLCSFLWMRKEWSLGTLSLSWASQSVKGEEELGAACRKGFTSSVSSHCLPRNPALRQKCLDFIYRHRVDMPTNLEGPAVFAVHIWVNLNRSPWNLSKPWFWSLTVLLGHQRQAGVTAVLYVSNQCLTSRLPPYNTLPNWLLIALAPWSYPPLRSLRSRPRHFFRGV